MMSAMLLGGAFVSMAQPGGGFGGQMDPEQFAKRRADEMKQTEEYLSLQKLRFGGDLKVVYHLDNIDFYIPTLTLQPLVENAVIHGIRESNRGMGIVSIRSKRSKDHFEVTVEDDGVGFDVSTLPDDADSHSAIKNVSERLKSVCGGELRIESEKGKGTKATIILPIEM